MSTDPDLDEFESRLSSKAREFWEQWVNAEPTEHAPKLSAEDQAAFEEVLATMKAFAVMKGWLPRPELDELTDQHQVVPPGTPMRPYDPNLFGGRRK